jgi:DNA polymerase I-like protein with 3'-5' exonuclease and polymerase domains
MTKLIALDLETSPKPEWSHYESAALDFNRSQIDLIALYGVAGGNILRSPSELVCAPDSHRYIMHGGKFDVKALVGADVDFPIDCYAHDTMLMAVAFSHKIPEGWLANYEESRKALNKGLGKQVHRNAGGYSLKTLAPYFLNVPAFWEVADHNDEEYALKDAEYTLRLYEFFEKELKAEDSWDFYEQCLMPWQRMLISAELRGVTIDFDLMSRKEEESKAALAKAEAKLKEMWADAFKAYELQQHQAVAAEYNEKMQAALAKLAPSKKKTPALAEAENAAKKAKTIQRYADMMNAAFTKIEPLNLASPVQLAWLLKEQLDLDITTFKGDEESTGKKVLQRLADQGREDVATFLEYREANKLITAFYPSYREKAVGSVIHTNFNLTGARTGRLSSNGPNLQQVPGHLHELFVARPGHKLICYDLSNIEPLLIAYMTEDPELCDLMLKGKSFHDKNVEIMFGIPNCDKKLHKKERDTCKEVGLSLLYGAGWRRLEESVAKRGFNWKPKQCMEVAKNFRAHYQTVFDFKAALDKQLESGALVRNIFGRPVVCADPSKIFMTGFNTAVQGAGSDLLLESARRASERGESLGLQLLLVVHDECIFEVPAEHAEAADAIVKEELTRWELPTAYGTIRTQCEGGISDFWRK